jgi:hypothetical protein
MPMMGQSFSSAGQQRDQFFPFRQRSDRNLLVRLNAAIERFGQAICLEECESVSVSKKQPANAQIDLSGPRSGYYRYRRWRQCKLFDLQFVLKFADLMLTDW